MMHKNAAESWFTSFKSTINHNRFSRSKWKQLFVTKIFRRLHTNLCVKCTLTIVLWSFFGKTHNKIRNSFCSFWNNSSRRRFDVEITRCAHSNNVCSVLYRCTLHDTIQNTLQTLTFIRLWNAAVYRLSVVLSFGIVELTCAKFRTYLGQL